MKGTYKLYKNGKLILAQPNVITEGGRMAILRFLAGEIPSWAGAIAVGAGTTVPDREDTHLNFEYARVPVTLTASNLLTNRVVAKGTLSTEIVGTVYEMGIWSQEENPETEGTERILTVFNPRIEIIEFDTSVAEDLVNTRIGGGSIKATPSSGNSSTIVLPEFLFNGDNYQGHDRFSIAYHNFGVNSPVLKVRMRTDATNYYYYEFAAGAGWQVSSWTKDDMLANGSPVWSDINSMEIIVESVGGDSDINLDAIRIDDLDPLVEYSLISRTLLSSPEIKLDTEDLDIEYEVEFDI